jgi:type VI secretion system protein ImpG
VFISLVDGAHGPFHPDELEEIGVEALCTNRDMPLLPIGDFKPERGEPIARVQILAGPTKPRVSHPKGDTTWRLLGHLSLGYGSWVDENDRGGLPAVRELLRLYSHPDAVPAARKQIDSIIGFTSRSVAARLPRSAKGYVRGMELTVTGDEDGFEGSSLYLFGMVLDRFFAKGASINSFTETVLHSKQRGEIARWPPRAGFTPTL